MDFEIEDKSKDHKEITVTIAPDKMNKYLDKATQLISSETKIDGFRPGKAPREIVEEKFGKERLWKEACYQALNETYPEVIKKNNLPIISHPEIRIDVMEVDKPFSYKIILLKMPEIKLPDYKKIAKKISKEKKDIAITEKEIDENLSAIRKSRAKIKSVAREAQDGDDLLIDFQGSIDGVKQEGLSAKDMNLVLGEKRFIKGFEENLLGMKDGQSKDFSLEIEMPDESQEKASKKKVDFKVDLKSVREKELPELNDDFAKSLGHFTDLKDLKEKLKKNIQIEKDHKEKERIRIKIIESIGEKTEVDIPKAMIDRELDVMIQEFKEQFSQSGNSFNDYLDKIGKDEESIKKEWTNQAKKRIITSLILQEIAKIEKIEVNDEEVEKEANNYLNRLQNQGGQLPDPEKLRNYIRDIIKNERVFSLLES